MYDEKHAVKKKTFGYKKSFLLLISLALVLTVGVGSTIAYLVAKTPDVTNTFTPSKVTCAVVEPGWDNGDKRVKKNVTIKNIGDTDAYIRAAIVVTWKDKDGNVYAEAPVADRDYTMNIGNTWRSGGDGYYYYPSEVKYNAEKPDAAECMTDVLINSCSPNVAAPAEGYTLSVEILAEAIQSQPTTAVIEAWGEAVASLLN